MAPDEGWQDRELDREKGFPGSVRQLSWLEWRKPVSSWATLIGPAAANDPGATNIAQIVIGTKRLTPEGALSMPAFGHADSDGELAAVAN